VAQKLIKKKGFASVFVLSGGWKEWFLAKYPTEPK
jgi:3-mercaptopyruvate sulfurtransferase SseA